MSTQKRKAVTIETRSRTFIRPLAAPVTGFCAECGLETAFYVPESAAARLSVTPRAIYRELERGTLHFTETPAGFVLICGRSLPATKSLPNPKGEK